ncbi:MAG TPA: hypothetical protein VGV59_08655 [Pyrinomonadaceae bacterium]|nr:hypothetical protein [Pyrinomonadaceae bacterium]
MRSLLAVCLLGACLSVVGTPREVRAQATGGGTQAASSPQQSDAAQRRAVGEVLSVDAAARRLVVRTDAGESVTVEAGERTSISRLPAGATTQDKAVKISFSEIAVGERVFVRGDAGADAALAARQIVVTPATAAGQAGGDAMRAGRGLVGQITALNAGRREITVETRGREGGQSVTVALASDAARIRRFAPDSLNPTDAVTASFADLRVGDQLRATGERSADGTRFTAEEIVSGSILRIGGTVTAVNAAAGEITVKAEQTGQTHTIALGRRSMLRRIPQEVSDSLTQQDEQRRAERREQRREASAAGGAQQQQQPSQQQGAAGNERAERRGNGDGRGGRGGRGGGGGAGGRNLMQMLENLPALTIDEIKKGDTVLLTITTSGKDTSRGTAVTLLTGDPAFLARLRRFQGRGGREGQGMSPGLPGDVIGGGVPNPRDQP